MSSTPRTPRDHYVDSERLLAVAESTGTDPQVQAVAALTAIGHALLAATPRVARRRDRTEQHHQRPAGGSPRQRWLSGEDDRPDDERTER
jgi:hypothetical protein